jgi:hypothetical protein
MIAEVLGKRGTERLAREQVLGALLLIPLIVATLGLAAVGLDAFNDLLARGLSSVGNPSG